VFHQGDPSDSIYVVVSGVLGAYLTDQPGGGRLLRRIGAGEILGEIGFITGEPRAATVKALRNCELLRVSHDELRKLAHQNPTVLMELCSTVIRRLRETEEQRGDGRLHPKTICIVPHDAGLDTRTFAEQMAGALARERRPAVLSKEEADGKTAEWFFQREQDSGLVIYLAEADESAWTRFCRRQADSIVLLARGDAQPQPFSALGPDKGASPSDIPTDLVLLWDRTISRSKTADWLKAIKPRAHHHVRTAADGARAARLITGHSVGLVLSGGGARGLAHVGVVRALQEHGVQFDVIGGASMGAIIGAGLALEWDLSAMATHCIDGFLGRPRLSDFGLPRSALFPGGRVRRLFDEWFGEVAIEETPVKYFCVSTNLSNGTLSVHNTGSLATWVQASAAIPGVFPPVLDEGTVHVDGGVLDNLPTDAMRQFGVGSIIAVNVGIDELIARGKPPSMLELLWRVGTIGSDSKVGSELRKCDVLLVPKVQHIHLLNWRAYEQAMEAGYQAAIERLADFDVIARRARG
jgi:NTE family protein